MNDKKRAVYLHGLESSQGGKKVEHMRLDHNVYAPNMDYKQPGLFEKTLEKVKELQPKLLIGSSMGGYFAYQIATHTGIPVLLFNPALHSRGFQPTGVTTGSHIVKGEIVLGRSDKVIPPWKTLRILKQAIEAGELVVHKESYGHRTPFNKFIAYL
tara:strand:- start:84 stop:551 length:468 start_codon:yes stop_codon:yes gene_type:complete